MVNCLDVTACVTDKKAAQPLKLPFKLALANPGELAMLHNDLQVRVGILIIITPPQTPHTGASDPLPFYSSLFFFFKDLFIYSFRENEREAETQAEGEAGSMQEARCGTRSRVSRITPRAAGGAKPLRHQGYPTLLPL